MSKVDPEILAALDEERGAMASSGRQFRSLRLKANESALARFLPVQMGPKKTWFARIAHHWVNKRPVLCQRQTSPHFNGDPGVACPLCDLEAEFSQSADRAAADLARKMSAFPKILTYVFVFEITDDRGRKLPTPPNEIFIPSEYWLARDGWKEIESLWRRSLEKSPEFGFLDPVSGYDFTISRDTRNGYRHMREDPQPIDPNKDLEQMLDIIDKAFRKVKQPDTTPLTREEMDATVEKAREMLEGSPRSRSRREASPVDRDPDQGSSRERRREPEPAASGREASGSREESAPSREVPAASTANRRSAVADVAEPEAPATERSSRRGRTTTTTTAAVSSVERELDAQPQPVDEPPPPVRATGGAATPSRRAAPPPPARGGRIESDPEEVIRERRDPAPPAGEAAPAPARGAPAGAPQERLSSRMRESIGRLGGAAL